MFTNSFKKIEIKNPCGSEFCKPACALIACEPLPEGCVYDETTIKKGNYSCFYYIFAL